MGTDYTTVTEEPGHMVTREQLARNYTRYDFASRFCAGKDVLEVACGCGQGLGYMARRAKRVVGGDYTDPLLRAAGKHYKDRIALCRLDAQFLPFRAVEFDVVVLFEAMYYLAYPEKFVDEARRVLRPDGVLLISSVNREWDGFNPSPFSMKYLSASELSTLLQEYHFDVELFGAFSVSAPSLKSQLVATARRLAVASHLIPKTMEGKEFFKRIFYGTLYPLEPEIREGVIESTPLEPIPEDAPCTQYKIVYAIARKQN